MKYIILLIFMFGFNLSFSQSEKITGDKKKFDRIIQAFEENISENYETDSLPSITYNVYHYRDEDKHLLKALYIKGVDEPYVWFKYVKYIRNADTLLSPIFWDAKLYEEIKGQEYNDIYSKSYFKRLKTYPILLHREKKQEIHSGHTLKTHYEVKDTVFNGENCFKLIVLSDDKYIATKEQISEFKKHLKNEKYQKDKMKLSRLFELNKNSSKHICQEYIINKKDYAIIQATMDVNITLSSGITVHYEWSSEEYERVNDKYIQKCYKSKSRHLPYFVYVDDGHHDVYTLLVKRMVDEKVPENIRSIHDYPAAGYTDFCEIVESPDDEMLKEWNEFLRQEQQESNNLL